MAYAVDELVRRSAVFRALSPEQLQALCVGSGVDEVPRGAVLWHEGDQAAHLAVVVSGRFKQLRELARGDVLVDVAFPGELLGASSVVLHGPQLFTVTCLLRGAVVRLAAEAVRAVTSQAPAAAWGLCVELAHLAERLTRGMEDLSVGHVSARLARVLLRLADRAGEAFDGGILIPLRLPRADLAALAATTVESTSRQIARWRREGVVVPQPGGYLIRQPSALRALTS